MKLADALNAAPHPDRGTGGSLRSEGESSWSARGGGPVVAMTRPDEDGRFTAMLLAAGFTAPQLPLTRIAEPGDADRLDRAVARLVESGGPDFDVLLLTSGRAVPPLVRRLEAQGLRPPFRLPGVEVWVVGPATGTAARKAGITPDRVPRTFVAEALLSEARTWRELEGTRILFPRAEEGRDLLPEGLSDAGAVVTLAPAYRTLPDRERAGDLARRVRAGTIDAVPLTAGSAARTLGGAWRGDAAETDQAPEWPPGIPIVAIGPATRDQCEMAGLPVAVTAAPHSLEGVVAALREVLG
ncbi:MAG: uroporphyrinogen-III synthase [Gemmatimonadales bacterium]|nr:MAG: uroporphyrinogen-III synthase [Gemmatimonadales bacterium]